MGPFGALKACTPEPFEPEFKNPNMRPPTCRSFYLHDDDYNASDRKSNRPKQNLSESGIDDSKIDQP
jgi:hypothetical protein